MSIFNQIITIISALNKLICYHTLRSLVYGGLYLFLFYSLRHTSVKSYGVFLWSPVDSGDWVAMATEVL